jgi:hypothetical protein
MRIIPIDLRHGVSLMLATLLPFVPVVFMGVPLDVVLSKLSGLSGLLL